MQPLRSLPLRFLPLVLLVSCTSQDPDAFQPDRDSADEGTDVVYVEDLGSVELTRSAQDQSYALVGVDGRTDSYLVDIVLPEERPEGFTYQISIRGLPDLPDTDLDGPPPPPPTPPTVIGFLWDSNEARPLAALPEQCRTKCPMQSIDLPNSNYVGEFDAGITALQVAPGDESLRVLFGFSSPIAPDSGVISLVCTQGCE